MSPTEVVKRFLAASDVENWGKAARYLDVTPIERMRRELLEMARDTSKQRRPTIEEFMRDTPDMPREVAEYQLKQLEKAIQSYEPVRYVFADVKDLNALNRLTTEELAISWAKAQSFRYQVSLASSPGCPSAPPAALPKNTHSILGTVSRGTRAYVLVRENWAGQTPEKRDTTTYEYEPLPEVYELRYSSGQWKLVTPRTTNGVSVSCFIDDSAKAKAKK